MAPSWRVLKEQIQTYQKGIYDFALQLLQLVSLPTTFSYKGFLSHMWSHMTIAKYYSWEISHFLP